MIDRGFTDEDMRILRPLFVSSGRDYVATLRAGLLSARSGCVESATLTAMHRSAHSLKGAAMQIGFVELGALARLVEDALAGVSQVSGPLPSDSLDALDQGAELLAVGLDAVERGDQPAEAPLAAREDLMRLARSPGAAAA